MPALPVTPSALGTRPRITSRGEASLIGTPEWAAKFIVRVWPSRSSAWAQACTCGPVAAPGGAGTRAQAKTSTVADRPKQRSHDTFPALRVRVGRHDAHIQT